jgi:basic membrane protein A and related proteins
VASNTEEASLNTKRSWVSMALALTCVLVAAVGYGNTSSKGTTSATAGVSAQAPAATLKIGLVTDIGGLNDKSFNFLANKGLQQAKSSLGVTVAVKESKSDADYVPNLQYFAAKKYDLVIAVGFLMAKSVGQVAKQFPSTKFAIIDQTVTDKTINKAKNVQGLLFREQDAGYLVGYLAGLLQKQGGFTRMNSKNVMSTVGGLKIPPVDHYIAGFQAGAKAADPGVKLLNGYSNDFVAQDKCKSLAESQIAQGSDVVFQVAGQCGLGALDAAGEKKVWGIGVDANQASVGPQMLASAVKRVDQAVFLTIAALKKGTFKGGADSVFGLAQNGAGIEGINAKVPASIKAKLAAVAAKIKSGKIKPPTVVK